MGTHPIFESDFDCLTDRFGLRPCEPSGERSAYADSSVKEGRCEHDPSKLRTIIWATLLPIGLSFPDKGSTLHHEIKSFVGSKKKKKKKKIFLWEKKKKKKKKKKS